MPPVPPSPPTPPVPPGVPVASVPAPPADPAVREFLDARTGSGHDDSPDIAQFGEQWIRRRHTEVVIDVIVGAVEDAVEERVVDVLGPHARNLRARSGVQVRFDA
jgi:hypothetical protein